ncbi:transmembrane protein 182-like [Sigmodon hispidus]
MLDSQEYSASIMKIGIAALVAGIVGGVGIILFLVAFGTEYWLFATETCGSFESNNGTLDIEEENDEDVREYEIMSVVYHHEGFFWRCWFFGDDPQTSVWRYWFMNQPHPKRCIPGYLFPMQIAVGPFPHPSFDATAGALFSLILSLFVLWKEYAVDYPKYISIERSNSLFKWWIKLTDFHILNHPCISRIKLTYSWWVTVLMNS